MSDIQLLQGDALPVLKTLPSGKFHCCVTSPAYWGLRDYGTAKWEGGDIECDHAMIADGGPKQLTNHGGSGHVHRDCPKCGARRIDSQLGLEATPELYVARLVEIFEEVKRVLRDDGVVFLNIGDSYVSGKSRYSSRPQTLSGHDRGEPTNGHKPDLYYHPTLKDKDLCGIPWRVAFALQAAGWWLRSEITWCKKAPMPESVTDRPTSATEKIFLLTKSARYFYDAEAVRESNSPTSSTGGCYRREWKYSQFKNTDKSMNRIGIPIPRNGRNMWNYWLLSPEPFPGSHFAVFPTEIPRRAILAGSSSRGCCPHCGAGWVRVVESDLQPNPGGGDKKAHVSNVSASSVFRTGMSKVNTTIDWRPSCTCPEHEPIPCSVLDPFVGSGTTGAVCVELGRDFVGIDLNAEYLELARKRIVETQPGLRLAI